MVERRRQASARNSQPQFRGHAQAHRHKLVVEDDTHALPARREEERALAAAIAGIAQKQALHADLHALRQIGAFRHMRALAALDIDRRDLAVLGFENVDLSGEAELFGSEP